MSETTSRRLSELFHEAGLLDRLGESIPGLVYVYDLLENRNVFTNHSLAKVLGYSPEQVLEQGDALLSRVVHPDDMPRVLEHHAAMALLADGQVVEIEFRVRSAAGEWIWLHSWESALTRNEEGRTRWFLGIAHDVTSRVRAEEDLRNSQRQLTESEQRWRSIAENPFDFVVVIDRNYKYTFVNFVAPGVERQALLGKATPFDFVSKADHPAMQAAFDSVFKDGRATSYEVYIPTLGKWYSSLVGPIRDEDVVTHASVLTRDITAEKLMQEQARKAEQQLRSMEFKLAQSAKLEAVGQLAGGIAHDFNNLLTGISGIADLLADRPGLDETTRADVADLQRAVLRGTGLTRQLLAFSRQQPIAPTLVDLNVLFEETARMLRRLIREDIAVTFPTAGESLIVRIDRTQIEQVVINLALNACDAMPRGGCLRFGMSAVDVDEETSRELPNARPGPYVHLSVEDTGAGMDAATMDRIFEPFFTTKPIGAGTGLGLSLVHGIVHQNHGFIRVRSRVGQGTAFEIFLPRHDREVTSARSPAASRPGGDEYILLVEDDAMARRLTRRLLERLGYRVECAERGDEALRLLESGSRCDLLLTDVLLPGFDGHTLYQRVRQNLPGLAVVFMSGYTAEVFANEAAASMAGNFLQKPFSHDQLAEAVRAALDERSRLIV